VVQQLGDVWFGIVHEPGTNAIIETFDAASAQEVMVRAGWSTNCYSRKRPRSEGARPISKEYHPCHGRQLIYVKGA
jgi:hypothetical protein